MTLKPWREIAIPHSDVLQGTFQQSEFAADITAVQSGQATQEYQDAADFFERTFITEGMGLLLTSVARRLNGQGGDPVIQLQTAFGGGKTHTMLAVYHLAMRQCSLQDLPGIPALLDQTGLMDIPHARVAVLDGNHHAPGQAWKRGQQTIHTLWGELAWQLGGEEAFALLAQADATGTSPGKEVLKTLLEKYAPCVVLMDELVAYIRQFPEGAPQSGGTFESNLSFIQALTEAVKLVPNAIVLASLPESDPKKAGPDGNVQVGGARGMQALRALESYFGRVQALWKPVVAEEAFEIVRRRLFEPIRDPQTRDTICRAFADAYVKEGSKLPSETQEARYFDRLVQAYPIHPEVFDRLYEDWSTLEGFQRTRGVLKLMAKVISRLWKDDNKDLMILPGCLPLYDGGARTELTCHLQNGWDAVIDRDVDGERAETTELETKETRFGEIQAARRVARTLFFGTAPSAVATKEMGNRGMERAHVLLGCFQPGQTLSTYSDALNRLCDRLHYLNASDDKAKETTRFWFDTRANLRREMEDRKRRFKDEDMRPKLTDVLRRLTNGATFFDGVHVFTPHSDVPDDGALRLVVLPPDKFYSKAEPKWAFEEVLTYTRNNGQKPRHRGNRLLFLAPEHGAYSRVSDCLRTVLAWKSIVEDIESNRLVIDQLQKKQAEKELKTAEEVIPRAVRECYRWLLCPSQAQPTTPEATVEAIPLNTSGATLGAEMERVCIENEWVIGTWSPFHLKTNLKQLYWKDGKTAARAMAFWEDSLRYLYLPRLKDRSVLSRAITTGAGTRDFFGTACGQDGDTFEGFKFGDANVQLDDTLLLIEPEAAQRYEASLAKPEPAPLPTTSSEGGILSTPVSGGISSGGMGTPGATAQTQPRPQARLFFGSVRINASAAKAKLREISDEVISVLANDPNAELSVELVIRAEFPNGASDQTRRAVSENATSLGFKNNNWE